MKPEKIQIFDQFNTLSYLPFDSEIFGFPFFRLTNLGESLSHDLEALRKLNLPTFGCEAKVPSTDHSSIIRLQNEGYIHICDQVTFDISAAQSKSLRETAVQELKSINQTDLYNHADNFMDDRLSRDSRIPNETVKQFYSKWISNSFNFAGKTIYSLESGLCITQLKQEILKIDLLSVLQKRKGLGTRIIAHILALASEAKLSFIEVTSESDNEGAIKTYSRNGFKEKKKLSCLHFFHYQK